MSRNNLLGRGGSGGHSGPMGQQLIPNQIGQFMQASGGGPGSLEKLYWDRSPSSASYSATANYIRTSMPQGPGPMAGVQMAGGQMAGGQMGGVQLNHPLNALNPLSASIGNPPPGSPNGPQAPQSAQWSPARQPVIPYNTTYGQGQITHMISAQIPPEIFQAASSTQPGGYYANSLMIGGQPHQLMSGGGTFSIPQQYSQGGGGYLPHFSVTQYEPQDLSGAQKSTVSLGTPAMVSHRTISRAEMVSNLALEQQQLQHQLQHQQQQLQQGSMKIEGIVNPPVEEVEEEITMIDSPQHLPPVPGSARSVAEQNHGGGGLVTLAPSSSAAGVSTTSGFVSGSMTTRVAPSRLTYEASPIIQGGSLTDRVVVSTNVGVLGTGVGGHGVSRHQRVTSSPATISPREPLNLSGVSGGVFLTGMQQNITSDLLRIGLFWPILNPLIDMLRLIEVVDYRSSTSFKSLAIAISPDSSVRELLIQFGDTHELVMKLDPVNVDSLNGLALVKCALKEEEVITMKSIVTGKSFKISVKQLLLSGLTACQGKYLLSDTEHIKFGIQLSFNNCSNEQNAPPLVCVCPQSVHYEIKTLSQNQPEGNNAATTSAAGATGLGGEGSNIFSHKSTSNIGPEQVVLPRHVRELSADCIKGNRPISTTKLFLMDGTPAYNRLLVKIEGFEGFEDIPQNIPAVYLRASLGGGTKGYRCKVENWLGEEAHAEFDFDYRGNRTIKFSIINASDNSATELKEVIGTTQLNLLALLSLSKNQFRGSLPVNSEGKVLGRLKVGALFTNASTTTALPAPFFKAFSWAQALIGGTFIKITLHQLQGSLHSAHDPLFFRVSCGGVKVRSAKFTPVKTANSMDLKDEVMELPITPELLAASEQKDFILCVYSRYNAETSCHTASHYVKILPSVIDMPRLPPRVTRIEHAIMTPAAQEYAGEDFLITFTFGVHK